MDSHYRTEKADGVVTLWDDTTGIGLRFNEGETLSRYTASAVMRDPSITTTEEGIATLDRVLKELSEKAEEEYPVEFAPLKN